MNRFKSHLIVAAVAAMLAIAGSMMNSKEASAQGAADGFAVRVVSPLPVPASITGVPNVVIARNDEDPARTPYYAEAAFTPGIPHSIPGPSSTQRLTIEYMDATCNGGTGFRVGLSVQSEISSHFIPINGDGIGAQPMRLYVNPGSTLALVAASVNSFGTCVVSVSGHFTSVP